MIKSFAVIFDRVLLFIVAGFFAIAIAGYFTRDLFTILVTGITSALCVSALLSLRASKKKSNIDKKALTEMMQQFYFKDEQFALDSTLTALSNRYKYTKIERGFVITNKLAIYPHLKPKTFRMIDFCEVFKKLPSDIKKLVVLCSLPPHIETKNIINGIELGVTVILATPEQSYRLFRRLNSLPKTEYKRKKSKQGIKSFVSLMFMPRTARRYLLTALLLIGSSFIMPASIYFIIVGALCLVFAILAKLDIAQRFRQ